MAPFDLAAGLTDLDGESPTGPNLEFDAAFGALERAAQGKPEQQYGDTIIPAEEPDWKDVAAQAAALLDRTHDLRVLGHLAVARLHLAGLPDFAAGLTLIRQLLETRWEQVHPQLDPEDDNDPTLRANALLRIAHPGRVLRHLRDMPLAAAPRAGRFSWRDIGIATGAIESDAEAEKPSEAKLRAAFAETPPERLAALREAAATAAREAAAIPAAFDERAGPTTGPDLSDLAKLLREIERYIQRYAAVEAADAAADAADEAPDGDPGAAADGAPADAAAPAITRAASGARGGASALSLGAIATRAEALHLLGLVGRYYEKYEPSSPLPLLLDRARKLADKNFLEILRDLAPDGMGQAQIVVQSRDEG